MLALAVMMMAPNWGWGQLLESFETGLPGSYNSTLSTVTLSSGEWQVKDVIAGTTGVNSGSKSAQVRNATAAQMISPTLAGGVGEISFYVQGSTVSGAYQVNVSSDNGFSWSAAPGSPFTIGTTKTQRTINVGSATVNKVQFYRTGATIYIDDVSITSNGGSSTPIITVTPSASTGFTYAQGSGPSAEQTFTVSGSDLTADISIAASTNYEISKTSGTGYTTPLTFTQTGGIVTEQTVYVRLKAGLSVGDYNNETITATSTGAIDKTVICSGSVTAPPDAEPTNHATSFSAIANSSGQITVTWTDATGAQLPAAYLVKAAIDPATPTAPADGTPEADGALVQNIAQGTQTAIFTGLDASTTYNFAIWPYTNSGTDIDYKTDGTVPEANATTTVAPVMTVVNFDDELKWTAGSVALNSYASDHTYIDGIFSSTGGPALRNTTGSQDGFPGALGTYSWRLTNGAAEWTATISSGGIGDFSLDIRRWDGSPSPDYNLDWSIDNGVSWTTVTTIDNASLNNSSNWKTFSGTINSGVNNILIRLKSTGNTERIMVDNFSWSPFESAPATSTYTNTGLWSNASNWSNGIPASTTDVIINGNVTVDVEAECNNMTISPTGAVTGGTAAQILYVYGDLLIESNATGTGSFIANSDNHTIGRTTTIQRYLTGGWGYWNSGWHQISSPVVAQAISNFETTGAGNGYDFYGWAESTNLWMNYKADGFSGWNGGTNFNVGQGYMVSYEAATSTQTFTGTLNAANVTVNSLSKTGGELTGWHLLGNPFASAIKWNDGNWALNNVAGNAKIWHEVNKSYSDIASYGIIPSAQGFMVQVSSATNSLTIPALARTHDATAFYKSSQEQVLLVASETEGGSAQESKIIVNPMATEGFDFDYDSRFLAGYAPAFYSVANGQQLSTNSMAALAADKAIPLGFVKNNASAFTIELKESLAGRVVYLTDNITGTTTNLTEQPVYSFTSAAGDQPDRFLLTFGAVGIGEPTAAAPLNAYLSHNRLFVTNTQGQAELQIFDLQGRLLQSRQLLSEGLHSEALTLTAGVYVVRLQSAQATQSVKVIVQ